MPIEVPLAKLSPTMETGKLVKWMVKVGDKVKEGDTLADVETDKATMPMESFDEGVVAYLDVEEGQEIALGQRVLVLAGKNEDPIAIGKQFAAGGASKPPAAVAAGAAAQAQGTSAAPANGYEHAGSGEGGRIKASPLARKVAESSGVDLRSVTGTGPGGRIVRDDVEAVRHVAPAASSKPATTLQPAAIASAPRPLPAAPAGAPRGSLRIPHTKMRQTIAQRMIQAKQQAPEIHLTVEIRLDKVMAIRESMNKHLASEKIKLSVGDFITKAVAMALRKHPALNASYETDAIVQHGDINIGIAVALDGGLIVPVIPQADTLGLRDIRLHTESLADAARHNKLTPKQMMGGTFTISNLGMYGIKQFDAILNLPEVGILAVGTGEQKPVVENGQLTVGTVMTVTLTADHRAVDGATGADFLKTFKAFLEEPAMMMV